MKSPNPFFCGHDQSRFVEIDDPHNQFQCGACRISIKARKRKSCTCCGFNLHPLCSSAPESISSSHHPQHLLTLAGAPPAANLRCDLCPNLIEGMYYTCQINGRQCNFDLHPTCAGIIEAYPPVRVHTLDPTHCLKLNYHPDGTRFCDVCRKGCGEWAYRCGVCSVDAHVGCLVSPAASQPASDDRQPGVRKRDIALQGLKLAVNVVGLITGFGQLLN